MANGNGDAGLISASGSGKAGESAKQLGGVMPAEQEKFSETRALDAIKSGSVGSELLEACLDIFSEEIKAANALRATKNDK